jgi:DNA-binding response OmpR family regulator
LDNNKKKSLSVGGIWILEDDPGTVFTYSEAMVLDHQVKFFTFSHELAHFLADPAVIIPGLLIADLRLPDGSFLNYLEKNGRSLSEKCPIVVVSSVEETEILHKCFEYGAVDYLTKPFSVAELRVKIERLMNRGGHSDSQIGMDFSLDAKTFEIHAHGKVSPVLTQKEFQIMALLKDSPNAMIEKSTLNSVLQGLKQVGPKALDVHLVNLRRKLTKIDYQIHSVQNQGIVLCRSV